MSQAQARIDFAKWLKSEHPELFARATKIAAGGGETLGALGETDSFWSRFTKAAAGLGTTYLALKNQRDAMRINLERAKAGQPPIDVATSAPVVRTQVELSPQMRAQLASTAGEGINKTLLLVGAGVAAFLYVYSKKR